MVPCGAYRPQSPDIFKNCTAVIPPLDLAAHKHIPLPQISLVFRTRSFLSSLQQSMRRSDTRLPLICPKRRCLEAGSRNHRKSRARTAGTGDQLETILSPGAKHTTDQVPQLRAWRPSERKETPVEQLVGGREREAER